MEEKAEDGNGAAVATERSESDCILDRIWNAELVVRSRESTVEELKEELKEARAEYDGAVKALRRLAQAKNESRPLFESNGGDVGGSDTPPPQPAESSIEPTSTEWRKEPIETLLQPPIAGMGAKKWNYWLIRLQPSENLKTSVRKSAAKLTLLPSCYPKDSAKNG